MGARVGRDLWLSFAIANKSAKHELVKVHGWGAPVTDEKIVLSYRDPVDIAASRARMGWPHDLETIRDDIKHFRRWQNAGSAICFNYDSMILDPAQMALDLLLSLGIDSAKPEATRIADAVDAIPDWDGIGKTTALHERYTFMHVGHRAAGGKPGNRDGLDPEIARQIEAEGWVLP